MHVLGLYKDALSPSHAASSDHTARLWHVDRTDPLREYRGHAKAITAIAYNDRRL